MNLEQIILNIMGEVKLSALQKKQLALLEETVAYYSEDVNRRCVNEDGSCYYSPITAKKEGISSGCAVGRLLSKTLQKKLDTHNGTVSRVFKFLPKKIQYYTKPFLLELQSLHDDNGFHPSFWDKNGLTNHGIDKVEDIKQLIEENIYKNN